MKHVLKIVCFALSILSSPAAAHERFALVIGNAEYTNIPNLDNPVNDARLIGDTLRDSGFAVTMLTNANRADITQAVESFGKTVRAAGAEALAVFYFAGHGVRSDDFNYLIPLGVTLTSEEDITTQAISAEWVLDQYHAPEAISVMILDACRDNPFDANQSGVVADLGDGLARMTARRNNLIAYATGPGAVALDGESTNSPYTAAIVRAMKTPDLFIEDAFEQVRKEVADETGGVQIPWATSSLDLKIGIKRR